MLNCTVFACAVVVGVCAAAARGVLPATVDARNAALSTNSRAVPRLWLRRPLMTGFLGDLFFIGTTPGTKTFGRESGRGGVLRPLGPGGARVPAAAPGRQSAKRQGNPRPDQHDGAQRHETSNRLTGNPEDLARVRKAHHVANPASGRQCREILVTDDISGRTIERQRGAKMRLTAVAAIDGKSKRCAVRLRQPEINRPPAWHLALGPRPQAVQSVEVRGSRPRAA